MSYSALSKVAEADDCWNTKPLPISQRQRGWMPRSGCKRSLPLPSCSVQPAWIEYLAIGMVAEALSVYV